MLSTGSEKYFSHLAFGWSQMPYEERCLISEKTKVSQKAHPQRRHDAWEICLRAQLSLIFLSYNAKTLPWLHKMILKYPLFLTSVSRHKASFIKIPTDLIKQSTKNFCGDVWKAKISANRSSFVWFFNYPILIGPKKFYPIPTSPVKMILGLSSSYYVILSRCRGLTSSRASCKTSPSDFSANQRFAYLETLTWASLPVPYTSSIDWWAINEQRF